MSTFFPFTQNVVTDPYLTTKIVYQCCELTTKLRTNYWLLLNIHMSSGQDVKRYNGVRLDNRKVLRTPGP